LYLCVITFHFIPSPPKNKTVVTEKRTAEEERSKKFSKKQSSKQQALSPENYIRQKSRNLPVYNCWITSGWEEAGIAQVVVARQHVNGNVTFCMYLVDLKCLGVKDTLYSFNVPPEELEVMLKKYPEVEFGVISYELAHNIIYAALEFAEAYGFPPHKDFTQTTRFLLEEDTDDIPLIDIACGARKDGKPLYVNTGHETPAREKQILAQLQKTAGEGNYEFIVGCNGDDYDYEDDDDEDYDLDEAALTADMINLFGKVSQLSTEEQKAWLLEFIKKTNEDDNPVDLENLQKILIITHLLAHDYVDEDAVEKYSDELLYDLDYPTLADNDLPNSLFAGVSSELSETILDLYSDTLDEINKGVKEGKKAIEAFREAVGDAPIVASLELDYLRNYDEKKFAQKLEEYHTKYPDYFVIQLDWNVHLFETQDNIFQKNINSKKIKSLLSEYPQPVTEYEEDLFLFAYFDVLFDGKMPDLADKLARINAFEEYLTSKNKINTESNWMATLFVLKTETLAELIVNDTK
jgi:hypothetical protein